MKRKPRTATILDSASTPAVAASGDGHRGGARCEGEARRNFLASSLRQRQCVRHQEEGNVRYYFFPIWVGSDLVGA